MTINKLTDERIHQLIEDLYREWSITLADLRDMEIALIELQEFRKAVSQPIGAFHITDQQVGGTSDYIKDGEWPIDNGIIEVYAAPPAPVVPEECPVEIRELMASHSDALFNDDDAQEIWNACRVAMLER